MSFTATMIDHEMENLRRLAAALDDELDLRTPRYDEITQEALLCQESIVSIRELLTKLDVTRLALRVQPGPAR
jgi:hypothetical protein